MNGVFELLYLNGSELQLGGSNTCLFLSNFQIPLDPWTLTWSVVYFKFLLLTVLNCRMVFFLYWSFLGSELQPGGSNTEVKLLSILDTRMKAEGACMRQSIVRCACVNATTVGKFRSVTRFVSQKGFPFPPQINGSNG